MRQNNEALKLLPTVMWVDRDGGFRDDELAGIAVVELSSKAIEGPHATVCLKRSGCCNIDTEYGDPEFQPSFARVELETNYIRVSIACEVIVGVLLDFVSSTLLHSSSVAARMA